MSALVSLDEEFLADIEASSSTETGCVHLINEESRSRTDEDGISSSSNFSITREKEKKRLRQYRKRLKGTRENLQKQVEELSSHLEELLQHAAKRKKRSPATCSINVVSSRWGVEVSRLRSERYHSEAEQKRLLVAVNKHAAYIDKLRAFADNRLGVDASISDAFASWYGNFSALQSGSNVFFTTNLQQLESCYARIDQVMESCGLTSMPETAINSLHKHATTGAVAYFQHVNKVVLPFSYQQTCRALWKVVNQQYKPALAGSARNFSYTKSRIFQSRISGSLSQQVVARMHQDSDRLVFVWKLYSEGGGALTGLHADETGCICFIPSPTGVLLKVNIQQEPMRVDLPCVNDPPTRQFYETLQNSIEADKQAMTELLENFLLEDVLTGIEC